jgi:hypothetical protein
LCRNRLWDMLEKFVHRVVLAKPKDFRDKDRAHTPQSLQPITALTRCLSSAVARITYEEFEAAFAERYTRSLTECVCESGRRGISSHARVSGSINSGRRRTVRRSGAASRRPSTPSSPTSTWADASTRQARASPPSLYSAATLTWRDVARPGGR